MRPDLVAYLTNSELNGGHVSTLEEFRCELRKFPRNAVVRLCSVMNSLIATWMDYDSDVQTKLVRSLFPPRIASKILETNRPAFHRHQLLFVVQEALRHCPEDGVAMSEPYWGGVGTVLLMANDHLGFTMPDRIETKEKALEVIACLLPTLEANNFTSYLNRMARSHLMITKFVEPLRSSPSFFDVEALFEAATNVPLATYQALLWASIAHIGKIDELRNTNDLARFGFSEKYFQTANMPVTHVEAFLKDISASHDDLTGVLEERNPVTNDFTVLRDKPVVSDRDNFLPIDFTFVTDKLESGVFWRVHNNLVDQKQRERFHGFWGLVFEHYLNWIFQQSCTRKTNRFYPDPRFASDPNEQVCDALVICGRAAVLMEYKSSTFTAESKYRADASALKKEIELKLIGTPEKRKGVCQLAHAVEKLCRRENADSILGIDMADIVVVLPVIVTRDDIGSAWGVNTYLNARFSEVLSLGNHGRPVTDLFCLSADDVEKISSYLHDTSLAELLSARKRQDKYLMSSFWTSENKLIGKRGFRKPQFVRDALKQLTQLTVAQFGLEPN